MRNSMIVGALAASAAFAAPTMANDSVLKCIADEGNWCMQQHDYANQRFSKLDQINTKNVGSLQVAWTFSTVTQTEFFDARLEVTLGSHVEEETKRSE